MFDAVVSNLTWSHAKRGLIHFASTSSQMPISDEDDEENIELDAYDHEICELETTLEQTEGSDIDRDCANIENCEDDVEKDCEDHDESAETEQMGMEMNSDFISMLQHVPKIREELQSKKMTIEKLMCRLNECSTVYRIENLVTMLPSNGP